MSETVFSSVSTVRLKMHVENRVSGSKKALYVAEHFDQTLSTLLVGNNIVNIALATLSVGFFTQLLVAGNYIELVSTLVTTIVVLIFGEIFPKTIAKEYSEAIALKIGIVIYILSFILFPVVKIFMFIQRAITRKNTGNITVDEAELEAILDTMEEEGAIKSDEVEIIRKVFDLDDRSVEDIMVPRVDILAIDIDSTVEEVKQIMLDNQYSRVPVYKEDKDNIVGILYERDFFASLVRDKDNSDFTKIMRPVKYVSKTMSVGALIHELQRCKTHIAIVSGEYNDTLGLVTMEDALEELVGEIYDEHDDASMDIPLIQKVDENQYIVDGEMYIDDLFEDLNIGEAPEGSAAKVSSFIYDSTESIPVVGYKMNYITHYTHFNEEKDGYEDFTKRIIFEVCDVDSRRIRTVKVTIEEVSDDEEAQLEEN